jgi:16S rRNA G1207 methylase RsmC
VDDATSGQYFEPSPRVASRPRTVQLALPDLTVDLTTDAGVFSAGGIEPGTKLLLLDAPAPPADARHLLDLGCGYGPIAVTLARRAPGATVWAVDVNERALDLVRRNAADLGLTNVNAVLPDDVPDDVMFRTIRSNPPIRVGKNELHSLLERWLPRLDERADAWLVVQRNLGSDSLQRWLAATLDRRFTVQRSATARGFRVLKVRRHGSPPSEPIALPEL